MKRELYIAGKRVDLPDSSVFNITYQVADPGKFQIYGSGSSTIKLPFTAANDMIFSRSRFVPAMDDGVFSNFAPVRYYEDGILLIDNATATLVGVTSDSYEICVTFGNTEFIGSIKNKPMYEVNFEPFTWKNDMKYPLAETSSEPLNKPSIEVNPSTKNLKINPELTRPVVAYSSFLTACGLDLGKMLPDANVGFDLATLLLQVNGKSADGRYILVENMGGSFSAGKGEVNWGQGMRYYSTFRKAKTINVKNGGKFDARFYDPIGRYEVGNASICFILTQRDYGEEFNASSTKRFFNAFSDDTQGSYVPMKWLKSVSGSTPDDSETLNVTAVAYANGIGDTAIFRGSSNWNETIASIPAGEYYLYCGYKNHYDEGVLTEFSSGGASRLVMIEQTQRLSTDINSPTDPILSTAPPDVASMLGYENVFDAVEDFMKIIPYMVQNVGGNIKFFGFKEVIENKTKARDWSQRYVSVEKITFGNANVAKTNKIAFADYDGYVGKRSDYSFNAFSSEYEKEFSRLKEIASYDNIKNLVYRRVGSSSDRSEKIPEYPLFKVTYDDKESAYRSDGISDIPNVLMRDTLRTESVKDSDGNNYICKIIDAEGATYQNFFAKYWEPYVKVIRSQKKLEIKCLLKAVDLVDFDYSIPVYFSQLSAYVFVNKITYKGSDQASIVECIIL